MSKTKFALISLLALSWMFNALAEDGNDNVLFVVDKSGSMSSRMPAIKSSVAGTASSLSSDHMAGLITFDGCGASKVYYPVPIARRAGSRIAAAVNSIRIGGSTALAEALKKVDSIMTSSGGKCLKVIVFTDSDDTCGGNVGEIAKKWKSNRAKYCISLDVVTTTQDEQDLKALEDLARELGGDIHIGQYEDEVTEILRRITARRRTTGEGRGSNPGNDRGNGDDGRWEDNGGDGDDQRRERRRRRRRQTEN